MLVDGPMAYANDWAFASRENDQIGWLSRSPHRGGQYGHAWARFAKIESASEDLSRFAWNTNNSALKVFPEMDEGLSGYWNEMNPPILSTWERRWEIFGPLDPATQWTGGFFPFEDVAISADASTAVATTSPSNFGPASPSSVRGLAGPGDPTSLAWPDHVAGRSVYLADISGGLTDTYAGSARTLVNVCTGDGGDRTELPSRLESGKLAAAACLAADPGRDARLISSRGATLVSDSTVENVVSEDGSRVFFLGPDPNAGGVASCSGTGFDTVCPPQLFVRQAGPSGTAVRWISRAAGGLFGAQDATLTGGVRFEGASSDGDKVVFRTNSPLTEDDPNGAGTPAPVGGVTTGTPSANSWDVYMYDFPDDPDADPEEGSLTRISAGPLGTGDCNSPLEDQALSRLCALSQMMVGASTSHAPRHCRECLGPLMERSLVRAGLPRLPPTSICTSTTRTSRTTSAGALSRDFPAARRAR
jgi:hypothetical protein